MQTVDFLRKLLPRPGFKVIAEPNPNGGFRHYVRETVEEAAQVVAEIDARGGNAFYALATFKERRTVNPNSGKEGVRFQSNALALQSLFLDLDVDEDDPKKFPSKKVAIEELKEFCKKVSLPQPMLVDSGGGIHAYWPFTAPVAAVAWTDLAVMFKALLKAHGLRVDYVVPADCARVLRPAGSHNHKRSEPRPVTVLKDVEPYEAKLLRKLILAAAPVNSGSLPVQRPAPVLDLLGSNTDRAIESEPLHFPSLVRGCAQLRAVAARRGDVGEPLWYAALSIGRLCSQAERAVAILSDGHPEYDVAATARKVDQLVAKGIGPATCAKWDDLNPGLCASCPYFGKIKSPAVLGHKPKEAPPPVITLDVPQEPGAVGVAPITVTLINPPKPYVRREKGGIALYTESSEGVPQTIIIYEYDIYPVRRVFSEITRSEAVVWRAQLPKEGWVEFEIESAAMYDANLFLKQCASNGVYPSLIHKEAFKTFMVAYVQELQKQAEAERVFAKLGWRDDKFVLGDQILTPTGPQSVHVAEESRRALPGLGAKGDFDAWREATKFYLKPGLEGPAFAFLAGFGAPLLGAVGMQGSIINMLGTTGTGKSMVLQMANSIWGHPEQLLLNGTPGGSTYNARNARIALHNNLPVAYDEISLMDPKEASALCYAISQGKGKLRLTRGGHDKGNVETWCTILIASSNQSLYSKLSSISADASAEQARVFEFNTVKRPEITKAEGEAILAIAKENHGHAGVAFMDLVVRQKANVWEGCARTVTRLDSLTGVGSAARFWTATAAVTLAAGKIAIAAGILPWTREDLKRIEDWAVAHIKQINATVAESVLSPEGILGEYLDEFLPNTLIVGATLANGMDTVVRPPHGPLFIRHERDRGYVYVTKSHFKNYCLKKQVDANGTIRALVGLGVILNRHVIKKVLGAGTEFAKGQVTALVINIGHPALAGTITAGGEDPLDTDNTNIVE